VRFLVFGSSILSSYWNGAATYYRGIYKELHRLGHEIIFAEPDCYGRQQHLDASSYPFVLSVVYQPGDHGQVLQRHAANVDVVIKHSGLGADDAVLEEKILSVRRQGKLAIFWDVDAPATLARVEEVENDPFRYCIPSYDAVFTYGGGAPVTDHYTRLGARRCQAIYNALDSDTHFPVDPDPAYHCDLLFIGNRLPDRERRVEQLFLQVAESIPQKQFILGGEGWSDKRMPQNVRWIGHVPTNLHNLLNCSARMVININRDSMAAVGFSPPTRIFEAAGSGACLLCDEWPGIESFFLPQKEILVVSSAQDVLDRLRAHESTQNAIVGKRFRERALRDHTYRQRALEVDTELRRMIAGMDTISRSDAAGAVA
jgi:spore maturation protein CgeB